MSLSNVENNKNKNSKIKFRTVSVFISKFIFLKYLDWNRYERFETGILFHIKLRKDTTAIWDYFET